MTKALARLRHVAIDLDGTIYNGSTLFSSTPPFLESLRRLEMGYTFVTNNSSRSVAGHLKHFQTLGLEVTADEIYTSSQATIEYLRCEHPGTRHLFVLGTPGLEEEFRAAGFTTADDSPADEPQLVVAGFDTGLTYSRLCRAAYWIQRGIPFIATHPDRICPTDQPTLLVDCGGIVACLKEVTGREPIKVLGKPDPLMLGGILQRNKLMPDELAMIGDRLYTDMKMACRAGVLGILVLSGETTREQASQSVARPDLIFEDIAELGGALERAKRDVISA
jgi:HAD superfamily hydrolase (TIGR01450 family)